jgi:hydrogenase expression/formation protein HypD
MRYSDEFRNERLVKKAAGRIRQSAPPGIFKIMEVCGTHTQSFFRFGLDQLLPANLEFIAGPGCPVCVSPQDYIDRAIAYTHCPETCVLTFGDMLRVPGTLSSLDNERSKGHPVHVVYSPLDALTFAIRHPSVKVVFLAVGFETTACTIAQTVLLAERQKLKNLFFFSSLKTIPAAMRMLLADAALGISAFLCPGHVSAIIGTKPYEFIPQRFGIGCCVAGFEPLDILEGIYLLVRQIVDSKPKVENQYARVVTRNGNASAQACIRRVFVPRDALWRGLGVIPASGLALRPKFEQFDAAHALPVRLKKHKPDARQKLCRCGEVIKGLIRPDECALFRKSCTPVNPWGPCMVSSEGACNAYYTYRHRR